MNIRRRNSTPPNVDGPPYSSSRSRSSFSNRPTTSSFGSTTTVLAPPSQFVQPSSTAFGQQQQIDSNGRLGEYILTDNQQQLPFDYNSAGYLPATNTTTFIGPKTTASTSIGSHPELFSVTNSSSFPPTFYGEDSLYSGLSANSGMPIMYYPPAVIPTQQVLMPSNNNCHHPSPSAMRTNNNNNKNKGDHHNNSSSARPSTASGFHPHSTSSSTGAVQQQPQPQQRTEDWIDLEDVMDGPSATADYHMNTGPQHHPPFVSNSNNNPPPLFIGGVSGSYPLGVMNNNTPPPPLPGPSTTTYGRNQQRQYVRTPPHQLHDNVEQQQQQSMTDGNMMMRMQQQQQQQQRGRSITPPPYHSNPGVNYYYADQLQQQQYPMDDHYYQQLAAAGHMKQPALTSMMMMAAFPQQQQQRQQDGYHEEEEGQQRHHPHQHVNNIRHHPRRSGDATGTGATNTSNGGRLPFSTNNRRPYPNNSEMMTMSSKNQEEEEDHNAHEEDDEDGPIESLRYGLQKEHLSDLNQGNLHRQTQQEQQDEEDQQQRQREEEEDDAKLMMMKRQRPASSIGENRLKIKFESFGTLGEIKQTYGRRDSIIPNGLCGSNEVYNERWRFEIKHHRRGQRVMIDWLITNLATNKLYTRRETVEESIIRETQGKTICNQVLKQALDDRADELEKELRLAEEEKNTTRVSNLTSRVRALRPKRCLVGLLFFGLQHQCVQDHMKMLEEQQQHQGTSAVVEEDGVHDHDRGDGQSQQQQRNDSIDNKGKEQAGRNSHGNGHQ